MEEARQICNQMIEDIIQALIEVGYKIEKEHHRKGGRKKCIS